MRVIQYYTRKGQWVRLAININDDGDGSLLAETKEEQENASSI